MLDLIRKKAEDETLAAFPNDVQNNYVKGLENAVKTGRVLEGTALITFIDTLIRLNPYNLLRLIQVVRLVAFDNGLKECKDLVQERVRVYRETRIVEIEHNRAIWGINWEKSCPKEADELKELYKLEAAGW